MSAPTRVLFLCTHNSARSQMAEGYLRALGGDRFDVESAGTIPGVLNPFAVQAMAEDGVDIALHRAKTVEAFVNEPFDIVITVCDDAAEACPTFPNAKTRLHWSFRDPSTAWGDDDEKFAVFERVRDEIRARIERELLAAV